MFERFTDRARRVLVMAQEEAKLLGHGFIGTEHLLLGLVAEGEGVGAKALAAVGVDLADVRARVLAVVPAGGPVDGPAPFTPRSKKVLEMSLREALGLGHNYIGTEHLLLGLLREREGVGAQVLMAAGVRLEDVQAKVVELLSGFSRPRPGPGSAADHVTPAGSIVPDRAKAEAGSEPLGSHHYLLAVLGDSSSLGGRLLQSFGVTDEAVRDRLGSMGVVGTSDELLPPPSPAPPPPPAKLELTFGGLTVRVDDDAMAAELQAAIVSNLQGTVGPTDMEAALRDRLADMLRPPPQPDADGDGDSTTTS
jgi:ATP-dependent Clp protease ATP-binding subunit ClpC